MRWSIDCLVFKATSMQRLKLLIQRYLFKSRFADNKLVLLFECLKWLPFSPSLSLLSVYSVFQCHPLQLSYFGNKPIPSRKIHPHSPIILFSKAFRYSVNSESLCLRISSQTLAAAPLSDDDTELIIEQLYQMRQLLCNYYQYWSNFNAMFNIDW